MGGDEGDGPEAAEQRLLDGEESKIGYTGGRGLGHMSGGLPPPADEIISANREYEAEHESEVDEHYDAMTPEQRDKAYVDRSLWTRIKQFWVGV
ncbi:MAG TPA: hypothetical protein VGZ03_08240 [Acidimicrobiales bacterium]|jgi:hypothetical protein|nr:hypothetical protein [Acidimicrobiales bacterium]